MKFVIFIYFQVASDWLYVYPRGIRDFLIQVKEKYNNPLIYITENGTQITCRSYSFPLLSR
jgi:beta-glucosidase